MVGPVNPLLVILNPRSIDECLSSYRELPVARLYVRRMSEHRIGERWQEILELAAERGHSHLSVIADDGIVRRPALEAVLELAREHPRGFSTGYSNLDETLDPPFVNLTKGPLGPAPAKSAYRMYELGEVMRWQRPTLPTTFVGMSLTTARLELWRDFPFRTWGNADPGFASDFSLSQRLTDAGVVMLAAREGFTWHVKETWSQMDVDPRKGLLVGVEPEELVYKEVRS